MTIEASCDAIADLLVDYSDGDLTEAERQRVAAHLAECSRCRSDLRLLVRSLEVAQRCWQESADAPKQRAAATIGRRVFGGVAAAACVLLLAVAFGPWLASRDKPRSERAAPGPRPRPAAPATPPNEVDVEAIIAREVQSARLAVSVEFLAAQPGLEQYSERARRYLTETYGSTRAAQGSVDPLRN